jgi:hypothetical protein
MLEPLRSFLITMPLFLYRCPNIGLRVQGFSADDVAVDTHTYEPVVCTACKQTHLINPATDFVLGADVDQAGLQNGKPAPEQPV